MNTTLTPPLKWHGGKHYLARQVVALMPSHLHYVEPFAGGPGGPGWPAGGAARPRHHAPPPDPELR
jgi:hypothetical protein